MFLFCLFASKKKKEKKNYHVLVLLFCKSAGGMNSQWILVVSTACMKGSNFLFAQK